MFKPLTMRIGLSVLVSLVGTLMAAPSRCGAAPPGGQTAQVELLGVAQLPGTAADGSGLMDSIAPDTPHNRLGGVSAIEYSGAGDVYYALSDRGPSDGAVRFACRWHRVELKPPRDGAPRGSARLLDTTLLRARDGRSYIGLASAFDPQSAEGDLRFDPEGLRRGAAGTLFVSDEYGPKIIEFDRHGREIRALPVPQRFLIQHPSARKDEEIALNKTGRVANAGFEGIAIGVDGKRLFALAQSPLLQDSAPSGTKRKGLNCRLLEIDLATRAMREFAYPLDGPQNKLSEILAVDEHQFLVIERDGQPGRDAAFKRVVRIDLDGASDVSRIDALPPDGLPAGVQPVQKSPFIDLLADTYGLRGPVFPEKVEGLAWGPTIADGRRVLWICVDNDFQADAPTTFYAFAIRHSSTASPNASPVGSSGPSAP